MELTAEIIKITKRKLRIAEAYKVSKGLNAKIGGKKRVANISTTTKN